MGGTRYKKLTKPDLDENKEAAMFLKWLEDGVFDALTKKFLSTVLLEIYEEIPGQGGGPCLSQKKLAETQIANSGDPIPSQGGAGNDRKERRLLEVFSFGVEYPKGSEGDPQFRLSCSGAGANAPTTTKELREAMKKSTSDVLRQLVDLTSTLAPLPKNRVVSMKLMYTPTTPMTYEPPMFRKADEDATSCWFENKPLRLSPGKIKTPYHQMLIHIRTSVDAKDPGDEDDFMRDDGTNVDSSGSSSSLVVDGDKDDAAAAEDELDKLRKLKISTEKTQEADVEMPQNEPPATESPVIDIGGSQGNTCRSRGNSKPLSESNNVRARADDGRSTRGKRDRATSHGKLTLGSADEEVPVAPVPKADDISSFESKLPAGIPHPKYLSQKIVHTAGKSRVGLKRPPLPPRMPENTEHIESQAPSFVNRKPRRKVSETVDAIYQIPKRRRVDPSQNHRNQSGNARRAENVSSAH